MIENHMSLNEIILKNNRFLNLDPY